jgi:D-alanyl-D-alanine carboxypeptidase/D-alanyl-D-alanine-endopeptidase (penicillin-binding protein 4)
MISPASAQDDKELSALPPALRDAWRATGLPGNSLAIVVRPLGRGGTAQIAFNDGVPMSPASTMKLVTTYAALELLGPAYRWRTESFATGPLHGDVLEGDLVIRGSGDPKLVVENLWSLVQRIRAYGVREIRGDVLLDRSAFPTEPLDPALFDNEPLRPYNAGPDALLLNFKTVSLTFLPDPDLGRARVLALPSLAGLNWPSSVALNEAPCQNWRAQLQADFSDPLQPQFRGAYPRACGERVWHVSLLDHVTYFSAVFRALWREAGGVIGGQVREGKTPADARSIGAQMSPSLAEVIRDINKFSNNVMARQIFLALGTTTTPEPPNAERSVRAVRAWLATHGLAMPELVLENGSGLSRNERISARSLARLLTAAFESPLMPEFMASLPIAGVDGTLATRRQVGTAAHIKGGMLEGVRAIAGYVQAKNGRRYVVVVIVNHANASASEAFQDLMLDWLEQSG